MRAKSAEELKGKWKAARWFSRSSKATDPAHAPNLRLRRALSWVSRAETEDHDCDASFVFYWSLLRNRDRLGFLYPKCHCEGRSAAGTPRLEDGGKPFVMPALPPGSWRREGHGASLPVMRASAREEMRRISLTIRSSSRLFAIHSRYRTSSSSVSFKPTVFPRALRVQWW